MTAVLTYLNEYCSVILADNRTNFGFNQEGGYEDGTSKLINLPEMGWVSGAGLADFLNILKETLATSEIKETNDITSLYEDVITSYKKQEPFWEEEIDASVMVASWIGFDGEKHAFRAGTMSNKHFGLNLMSLLENRIHVVYPGDFLSNIDKIDFIENNFDLDRSDDNFFVNLTYMLKVFKHITLNSNQVSETCDIGLQMFQPDGRIYKFKISGIIDELIDMAVSENFEGSIEIVD